MLVFINASYNQLLFYNSYTISLFLLYLFLNNYCHYTTIVPFNFSNIAFQPQLMSRLTNIIQYVVVVRM